MTAPRLVPLGSGVFRVEHEDGSHDIVYIARKGDAQWVFWKGAVFLLKADAGERHRPTAVSRRLAASDTITAPMPARVIELLAREGAHVQKGETVLLLEAMKMELPIRAPHDGEVVAVHCREGDLVQADAPLIELR